MVKVKVRHKHGDLSIDTCLIVHCWLKVVGSVEYI